jgi:hypothetical protein
VRRASAFVGSAILHVAVGAALIALVGSRDAQSPPPLEGVEVELVGPPPAMPIRSSAGGGTPGAASSVLEDGRVAPPAPAIATAATPVRLASAAPAPRTDLRGLISGVERPSSGDVGGDTASGGDGGSGGGLGGGRGLGIGRGEGEGIAAQLVNKPEVLPSPPPPPSLARPPRLIWPTRRRDVGTDELFVMRVKVDTDGYVDGAQLVRGVGGKRDAEAMDLIWNFRYEPALDDDGRPITATIDQRFGVNRY